MGAIPHRQSVHILSANFYYPPKEWGGMPSLFCSPSKKVAGVHLGTWHLKGLTIYLRGCSLADSVLN
jgi:hypothetical protein